MSADPTEATDERGLAPTPLPRDSLAARMRIAVRQDHSAVDAGAQVVVFSELTVTGYPPEDLLLKPTFVEGAALALGRIARHTGPVPAVVGFPEDSGQTGPVRLWNSAAMCWGGAVRGVYRKHFLPNYSVFDEQRYFVAGTDPGPLLWVDGLPMGISIDLTASQTGKLTSVSSCDASHSRRCSSASRDRSLDGTKTGWPRISMKPSGP